MTLLGFDSLWPKSPKIVVGNRNVVMSPHLLGEETVRCTIGGASAPDGYLRGTEILS